MQHGFCVKAFVGSLTIVNEDRYGRNRFMTNESRPTGPDVLSASLKEQVGQKERQPDSCSVTEYKCICMY